MKISTTHRNLPVQGVLRSVFNSAADTAGSARTTDGYPRGFGSPGGEEDGGEGLLINSL